MKTIEARLKASPTLAFARRYPFLSVIIPVYNAVDTLGEQLEALRRQSYKGEWELIIVNNRSTDGTVELVNNYRKIMPNLRLVHALGEQGKGYAANVGVKAAKSDGLIFSDADDVVASDWLHNMAEALESYDFIAGFVEVSTLNQDAIWRPTPPNYPMSPALGFLPGAIGCNMGFSRQAFKAVGGFAAKEALFCEDFDFSWRLILHGYTLHYVPAAIVHYRYRKTLWGTWKQVLNYAEAQVRLYRRFAVYGMPRPSPRTVLTEYKRLIRKIPNLWAKDPKKRIMWVRRTAVALGRLRGSLRYHTLYL